MMKYITALVVLLFMACSVNHNALLIDKVTAQSVNDFLNSIGVVSSVTGRGETMQGTIECTRYLGVRWIRTGYEDKSTAEDLIEIHKQTGVRYCYGLLSGGSDIEKVIKMSKQLAASGALLAVEGANEPNNWGITYNGKKGGGQEPSWLAVAELQRDLYKAVKHNPELMQYPVFHTSENGAQNDNVGLQYLTIPENADTKMPAGTQYADYANCHNYICHPSWKGLHDNQTWLSADPLKTCPVDGLYGNYGITWGKRFTGYSDKELLNLPRVTTETGIAVGTDGVVTEEIQARLFLNLYLSQFARGWKYTAIYLLKGRANEPEHEAYAFYKLDYTPKTAAHYLHNLTTILADNKPLANPQALAYVIPDIPETVHRLLLQKSNGKFALVIWGERFTGGMDNIEVKFGEKHRSINIYDPTTGVIAAKELRNANSVRLTLTNHPLVLEIG